ncbi:MAG: hypothetical protein ABFD92_21695 [Planctomycetaceae bacterium]
MRYEPGAAHILSCQLKNRSGEPIIDGTVSLYLLITKASTPVFENVWYKSDDSYNSPEEAYATATLATGSTQGVWAVEVRAEAFVAGRKYRAYWVDSAGRGEPYTEEIEVETGGTAIKTETATLAAVKPDYKPTVDSSGYTAVQADVDVDEAAIAAEVLNLIGASGVPVDAAATVGAFPAAALANSPATSPSVTITPAQISVSPGEAKSHATLYAYQYAKLSYTLTITDAAGTAITLTSKTLSMVFFDAAVPGVAVFTLATTGESGDNLVVSGDDSNIVTVAGADTHTQTARRLSWVLRNLTDDSVIGSGKLEIIACPA